MLSVVRRADQLTLCTQQHLPDISPVTVLIGRRAAADRYGGQRNATVHRVFRRGKTKRPFVTAAKVIAASRSGAKSVSLCQTLKKDRFVKTSLCIESEVPDTF